MKVFESIALGYEEDPESAVDEAVTEWHRSDESNETLSKHLGMSRSEYLVWVTNASALTKLAAKRVRQIRCFRCGEHIDPDDTSGPSPDVEEVAQAVRWHAMVLDVSGEGDGCRAAVCCWPCFWHFDPGMWIPSSDWTKADPAIPYEALPELDHDAWEDPFAYPYPVLP